MWVVYGGTWGERKLPNWADWYQPTCWWSTFTCRNLHIEPSSVHLNWILLRNKLLKKRTEFSRKHFFYVITGTNSWFPRCRAGAYLLRILLRLPPFLMLGTTGKKTVVKIWISLEEFLLSVKHFNVFYFFVIDKQVPFLFFVFYF